MTRTPLLRTAPRSVTCTRVVLGSAALLLVTSCGSVDAPSGDDFSATADSHYPVSVDNCNTEVNFEAAPERIALMETAPVPALDALGMLDHVVIRAGEFPSDYYDDDLYTEILDVPSLSEDIDASGHLTLSQEEIIAHEPDLVLGLPEGVTDEGLADAGAAVIEQEIYCPGFAEEASFDHVYGELERFGTVFDRATEADELIEELQQRVADVSTAANEETRSAAVLYPSVGGGPLYAYGTGSMAHPQLEALGFTNIFQDASERVFEVQTEELVGRDPDVLILLYQGDSDGVAEAVTALPGAETMTAVQEDKVLPLLFNYTEPATPLSVEGLELMAERFQSEAQAEEKDS